MKAMRNIFLAIAFLATTGVFAQDYKVDVSKSTLKWTGEKLTGTHWGYINLKAGSITLKNGNITGGNFTIDMNSIVNKDLESAEYNAKLVGHLKSDDFFGTTSYPEAKLVISKATPFKDNKSEVTGNLQIKAKTHPITFTVEKKGDKYSAKLTVDRSKYDVKYGSKSFFENIGDKVIYDDFILEVDLVVISK